MRDALSSGDARHRRARRAFLEGRRRHARRERFVGSSGQGRDRDQDRTWRRRCRRRALDCPRRRACELRTALPDDSAGNGASPGAGDPATVKEPLIRLKRLLETDDGEAADFIVDAKPRLAGVLTLGRDQDAQRSRRQFRFRRGAEMPVGHRLAAFPQPRRQMMSSTDKKLVLIVDDTPTNVAVVSGVLEGLVPDQGRHQRREGACHRQRRREAGSHPARRDDARHGRLRGLPPAQGQSGHARHSHHLPHRQDRGGRRGEGLRRRRGRLHPQAVLGPDRAGQGQDAARPAGGADRSARGARAGRPAAARACCRRRPPTRSGASAP